MTAPDLLAALTRKGVQLDATGGKLRYFPADAVSPDLLAALREHKAELLAMLRGVAPVPGEPLFPPWLLDALRGATVSLGDTAEARPLGSPEGPEVNADGWPADTVDPSAVAPCSKCGTLELWETAAGAWRCLRCDPPTTSRRIAALVARIRAQKPPKAAPNPKALCGCGSTRAKDTAIHGGQSVRQDCARCGRFLGFPLWYGNHAGQGG